MDDIEALSPYIIPDGVDPEDTDYMLFVRDGMPYLRIPAHDHRDPVPDDFLILLGMARSFGDPQFRAMMQAVVQDGIDRGELSGIVGDEPDEPIN